jgi:hypothetical protein
MTSARSEYVPADPTSARVFLDQAEKFVADGRQPETSLAGRQILYYQACLSSLEAILLEGGRRVTPGDRAHVLRIEEAHACLGYGHPELFERLDIHREIRHDVSYSAGVISEKQVESLVSTTTDLLAVARRYVEGESA